MDDEEEQQQQQQQSRRLDLQNLKFLSVLGRGAKGVVFLVRTESTGEFFALKVISKALIQKNKKDGEEVDDGSEYRRICFEQDVLKQFNHPLLPKFRGDFDNRNVIGYAIDYCPGRNLNSLRYKQTERMFSDDVIRFYAAELVLALDYLHELGIVYRDLKPENIMIQESGHLMLVDYDLSTKLPPKSPETSRPRPPAVADVRSSAKFEPVKRKRLSPFYKCCNSGISPEDSVSPPQIGVEPESDTVTKSNSFVGTEEYVAPEVILGTGHDFSVDWWSLGIVLYEMLYGVTPFRGSDRKETFFKILTKPPELVGERTPLRNLIRKLLEKDAKQRISVKEIKGHDFFSGIEWEMVMQVTRPPYIPPGPTQGNENEEEDTNGIIEVNVELLVQGIYNGNSTNETHGENNKINNTTSTGKWVEGLNNPFEYDNFLIF